MATPNSIITPQTPICTLTDFGNKTACTTRGPTLTANLGTSNIFEIMGVSTSGKEISSILIKGSSTVIGASTGNQTVTIWQWDGTTAFPVDEILITAVTPSITSASFSTSNTYSGWVLPPAHKLYASTSVNTSPTTTAFIIRVNGADL